MNEDPNTSWKAYRIYVVDKLGGLDARMKQTDKRLDEIDNSIASRLTKLETAVARLQVKSGVWGAVGAVLILILSKGGNLF